MPSAARLDLRLDPGDKQRIAEAAARRGMPVSVFVRDAVLRETKATLARPVAMGSVAARLCGKATAGMSTEDILALTRGE